MEVRALAGHALHIEIEQGTSVYRIKTIVAKEWSIPEVFQKLSCDHVVQRNDDSVK